MTAEDFFEWVRACARDVERIDRIAVRPRSEGSGSSMASRGRGVVADAIGVRVAAKVDYEGRLAAGRARCERVVEMGRRVIERVSSAVGQDAALALLWYYVELNGWEEISFELGVSLSTVYRRRRTAFEWVDRMGLVVSLGKEQESDTAVYLL